MMTEPATDKEGCAVKDTIRAQSGWRVKTGQVDMFVTEIGAHMAPVTFRPGKAVFRSATGVEVVADVNHEFLETGRVFPASGS